QRRLSGLPHGAPAAAQQRARADGEHRDLPALRPVDLSQGAARAERRRQTRRRGPRREAVARIVHYTIGTPPAKAVAGRQRSRRSAGANRRSRRVSMMLPAARAIAATGCFGWLARKLAGSLAPAHHFFAASTPFMTSCSPTVACRNAPSGDGPVSKLDAEARPSASKRCSGGSRSPAGGSVGKTGSIVFISWGRADLSPPMK